MSLNAYAAATALIQRMENGPQFIRIVSGNRAGSIGRVLQVRSKYFSVHDYNIHIDGRKPFWIKGNEIEHIPGYDGKTSFVKSDEQIVHLDQMGRALSVGDTILFQKMINGKNELVIGNIRRRTNSGAIYATIFHSPSNGHISGEETRVGRPQSAVILDRETASCVMLAKLAAV